MQRPERTSSGGRQDGLEMRIRKSYRSMQCRFASEKRADIGNPRSFGGKVLLWVYQEVECGHAANFFSEVSADRQLRAIRPFPVARLILGAQCVDVQIPPSYESGSVHDLAFLSLLSVSSIASHLHVTLRVGYPRRSRFTNLLSAMTSAMCRAVGSTQ